MREAIDTFLSSGLFALLVCIAVTAIIIAAYYLGYEVGREEGKFIEKERALKELGSNVRIIPAQGEAHGDSTTHDRHAGDGV